MSLVDVLVSAVLPVVVVAALGYGIGRIQGIDSDPIAAVTVHVLTPALAFHSIATTELSGGTLARIVGGLVAFIVVMTVVAELAGRLAGIEEPFLSALVLLAVFPNSGNFGIPLSEFAFGAVGRSAALVYMTGEAVLMYTVGVYVAARSGVASWTAGVRRVATVPLVYAVLAALAGRALGLVPPVDSTAMGTVQLVGDAAIPMMLLVLGIELARTDYGATLRAVGTATVLKMGVAPVVAVALALALGFGDATVARTFVVESAAPSAVTSLVLLIEFGDTDPVDGVTVAEFASTVILVSVVLSVPILTVLIALLQAGLV
ncbi:permease [Halobacteriales archaeon QS_4_69_31]|nr:MAG: permease [Halobacteriales archaeon QS_4_69_31]